MHPLLEKKVPAPRSRDGFKLRLRGRELDSLACKREQRFEQELFVHRLRARLAWKSHARGSELFPSRPLKKIIQKYRWRHNSMPRRPACKPRNGELADQEIPIRMPGPLHIPCPRQIEGQLYIARHQFVCNGAVVDAIDWNQPSTRIVVVQLVTHRFKAANIHDRDSQAS